MEEKLNWLMEKEESRQNSFEEIQKEVRENTKRTKTNKKELVEFRDVKFPKAFDDFLSRSAIDIISNIKKIQFDLVTFDVLEEKLDKEREATQRVEDYIKRVEDMAKHSILCEITSINDVVSALKKQVDTHQTKFELEEEEPEVMTEEQIEKCNIKYKNGMRFDRETGDLIPITKREMQLKFMEIIEQNITLKDQISGAEMSINAHGDQIKAFLKKLAFNKSDIMQITAKAKDDI